MSSLADGQQLALGLGHAVEAEEHDRVQEQAHLRQLWIVQQHALERGGGALQVALRHQRAGVVEIDLDVVGVLQHVLEGDGTRRLELATLHRSGGGRG